MNKQSHNVVWCLLLFVVAVFLNSCDKTPGIVDRTQSDTNLLINGSIKPTVFAFSSQAGIDTTLTIDLQVQVNDTTMIKGSPRFTITDNATDSTISSAPLTRYNSSTHVYSGSAYVTTNTSDFRELTLVLYAVNKQDLLTNTFRALITIKGAKGHAPQIISASNPDTVKIPVSGNQPIVFTAKVVDADGQSNIDRVLFDLISANVGKLSGSPFQMYDDGNQNDLGGGSGSGDAVAGDSVYTRTLQINSGNTPDSITVKYYAIDKSGLSSDTLSRSLIIIK